MSPLRRALLNAVCLSMGLCLGACTGAIGDEESIGENSGGLLDGALGPAPGARIRRITITQGVERPLVADGKLVASDVPLVAGRAALLRISFETDATYDGAPVTARAQVGDKTLLDVIAPLSGAPHDDDLQSTLNFEVPASTMVDGASLRVGSSANA